MQMGLEYVPDSQHRLPDSLMLEILPSMSAGSDKPRNGLMSRVEGGKSSSVTVGGARLLDLFEPAPPVAEAAFG